MSMTIWKVGRTDRDLGPLHSGKESGPNEEGELPSWNQSLAESPGLPTTSSELCPLDLVMSK